MANPIARCAALTLLFAAAAFAQTRRLLPVDQSARDPKLVAYLAKFKDAVAHRSRDELVPLIAPEIKLGFDGEDGIAKFQPNWPLLDRLLTLGGAWQGDAFIIPYVVARFPDDLDPIDFAVITGTGVWLRELPSANSRGLRMMNYEIVQVEGYGHGEGQDWCRVTTVLGQEGFVRTKFVTSPLDYRAVFNRNRRGEWKLSAFLAGD